MPTEKKTTGAPSDAKVTPDWEKILYTPERVKKYMDGELTGQQLHALTGPELLQVAICGQQMFEQGKYEEAQVLFDGLCLLDDKEPYYPTALGAVYLKMDELDASQKCFDRAIELNAKELAAYVNRGEVFLRKGMVMEAAQDFNVAVELDPQGKDPLTTRARLLAAAALEIIEQAQAKAAEEKSGKGGGTPAAKPAGKKK